MRKIILIFSLWILSCMATASPGWAACTIAVSASQATFTIGSQITLTATPTGCQSITQVSFYNGANLIGTVTQSPYTIQWNTTGLTAKTYSVTAGASFVNSTGSEATIDMVGDPQFATQFYPSTGPAPNFGSNSTWIPGDNEMCLTSWPYNGSSATVPDGTCQISGGSSSTANGSSTEDLKLNFFFMVRSGRSVGQSYHRAVAISDCGL